MAYKPKILTVPEGGSGNSSFTAYTPICGGTTATGALQSVASLGSSTNALTSNGASNLPSFQAFSGGAKKVTAFYTRNTATINDSTTYFVSADNAAGLVTANNALSQVMIPAAGTITTIYGTVQVGTLGTGENITHRYLINGGAAVNLSTSVTWSSSPKSFTYTGLSIAVSAGDYFQMQFVTPAFTSNPANVVISYSMLIS